MLWAWERIQQYLQRQSLRQGQLQELLQRLAQTELQRPALAVPQRPAWPRRLAQSPRIPQTLGQIQMLVWNPHQSLWALLQRLEQAQTEGPAETRQRQSSKLAAVQLLEHLSQTGPLQQKHNRV